MGPIAKAVVITGVVAFVAGVLVGAYVCTPSAPQPTPQPPTPLPPGYNPCNWPDNPCPQMPARQMLDEISAWAQTEPPHELDPGDQLRILGNCTRCKEPDLKSAISGKHVCDVQGPAACDELPTIYQKAAAARNEPDPNKARKDWKACADDLDSFPGGR